MKNDFLVRFLNEHPLAILPSKLHQIEAFLQFRVAGGPAVEFAAASQRSYSVVGRVAVIPVMGVIVHRGDMLSEMSGATSVSRIASHFRAALADPTIERIVFDIDSPGGSVYGIQELAAEIFDARGIKRMTSIANAQAASAAFWIGSAADQFVVTPSGEVGSIGVVGMHIDQSERLANEGLKVSFISAGQYKTEGNSYEPLGEDARAFMQQRVNEYYDAFAGGVARHRGVSRQRVEADFGQGRMFSAAQAKAVGMVDRIATLSDVISSQQYRPRTNRAAMSAEADIAAARLKAS